MVRVKVCGNTSREDIELAGELGADYVGAIVEVPTGTPRKLSLEKASRIFEDLPFTTGGVAVIMPSSLEEALRIYDALRPEFLQVHNQVEPEFVHRLKTSAPCNIIKAIQLDERALKEALRHQQWADAILLDTPSARGGGSGKTGDWDLAREVVEKVKKPVFLAGGLNPGNVREAIREVEPFGVDVSSGVESQPGKKDAGKLERFIASSKNL